MITVGQRVTVIQGDKRTPGFEVTSISRTGQITAKLRGHTLRFKPDGNQVGGGTYYNHKIIVDVG